MYPGDSPGVRLTEDDHALAPPLLLAMYKDDEAAGCRCSSLPASLGKHGATTIIVDFAEMDFTKVACPPPSSYRL
jgi:hypothetical protein